MTCPNCGSDNPAGQRFCNTCGYSLAAACDVCGTVNAPGSRFCGNCGSPLDGGASPATVPAAPLAEPVAERRLVSVLFADLVGFTPFSEGRDPEDVRALLTDYFDRCRDVVERFGGVVDKFIGDAVTAVWGGITTLEDDAERAVRAGLELVDVVAKLGAEVGAPELALRVGILTGEASVGPGGNQMGLVAGDMVNTASRLQSIADPGTVLVGESTYLAAQSAVAFEPTGEQTVKGKALPVAAWRAIRLVAERGGKGRSEMLEPPFVGRVDELRLLKDLLGSVTRERRARLVSIIGEAGIGKSRLVWEFEKYLDGLVETTFWHEGRSPAYGDGVTYWALAEMIRRRAGILENDTPEESWATLRACLEEWIPEQEERLWVEPRVAAVLGLAEAPSGDRAELDAALRSFFEAVASRGTTVMVFEDLHWADAGLLDFVEELTDWSRSHPILVVTLARADLLERRPTWGAGRRGFMSIHLGPLSDQDMEVLVTGLVPGLPDSAMRTIVERAAGVPLFAVEFIRMLLASGDLVSEDGAYRLVAGLEDLAVPESVRAVIGARLDRLESEERSLLQVAAVLGQTFAVNGLTALTGDDASQVETVLGELTRRELVEPIRDPRSPERGQYQFVQGLIREVTLGRMSREVRRARHLEAASYYEELIDPELAMVVASHYLEAYHATPEGEEADRIRNEAVTTLTTALDRAATLHAHEQVLSTGHQALDLAKSPATKAPIWERMSAAATELARTEESERYARLALDHYRESGDAEGVNRATRILGFGYVELSRAPLAVELLEPHLEAVGDLVSDPELAFAAAVYARALLLADSPMEEVAAAAERALIPLERLGALVPLVDCLITRGTAVGDVGRPVEARILLEGAVALADKHDLTHSSMRGRNNLSHVFGWMDPPRALEATEEAFSIARRVGNRAMLLFLAGNLAFWYLGRAEFGRMEELLSDPLLEDAGTQYRITWTIARTLAAFYRGDRAEADRLHEETKRLSADVVDDNAALSLEYLAAAARFFEGDMDTTYSWAIGLTRTDWSRVNVVWPMASGPALCTGSRERVLELIEVAEEKYAHQLARWIRLLRALLALEEGDPAVIVEAESAVAAWEESFSVLEAITARGGIARFLPAGHPDRARILAEAQRRCDELGLAGLRQVLDESVTA